MKPLKRLIAAGLVALSLSACANEPATITDVHTGMSAGTSKRYPVYDSLLVSVYGQAFVATKGGKTTQGVYINQIATGQGWAFYNEAYSFGTQLQYVRGNSTVLGCGAGCTLQEEGGVLLTAQQFAQAVKTGLEMKLVGPGGGIVVKIPAEAFQEAMAFRPGKV